MASTVWSLTQNLPTQPNPLLTARQMAKTRTMGKFWQKTRTLKQEPKRTAMVQKRPRIPVNLLQIQRLVNPVPPAPRPPIAKAACALTA